IYDLSCSLFLFFFSSRRRHTRWPRDWSSDVCSSDLTNDGLLCASLAEQGLGLAYSPEPMVLEQLRAGGLQRVVERYAPTVPGYRSEERRVGKECRLRGWTCQ